MQHLGAAVTNAYEAHADLLSGGRVHDGGKCQCRAGDAALINGRLSMEVSFLVVETPNIIAQLERRRDASCQRNPLGFGILLST